MVLIKMFMLQNLQNLKYHLFNVIIFYLKLLLVLSIFHLILILIIFIMFIINLMNNLMGFLIHVKMNLLTLIKNDIFLLNLFMSLF